MASWADGGAQSWTVRAVPVRVGKSALVMVCWCFDRRRCGHNVGRVGVLVGAVKISLCVSACRDAHAVAGSHHPLSPSRLDEESSEARLPAARVATSRPTIAPG